MFRRWYSMSTCRNQHSRAFSDFVLQATICFPFLCMCAIFFSFKGHAPLPNPTPLGITNSAGWQLCDCDGDCVDDGDCSGGDDKCIDDDDYCIDDGEECSDDDACCDDDGSGDDCGDDIDADGIAASAGDDDDFLLEMMMMMI